MKHRIIRIVSIMSVLACMPTGHAASTIAEVISVKARSGQGSYDFAVTIKSQDQGCNQYADWWEVLTPDGNLLYRRILVHSHVTEQPFTRSGGSITVNRDTEVIVRAHMHPSGYGTVAMQGSVQRGFVKTHLVEGFAADLDKQAPLQDWCAW